MEIQTCKRCGGAVRPEGMNASGGMYCTCLSPEIQTSAPPEIRSTEWMDALREDWKRTQVIFEAAYQAEGGKYNQGYADGIDDVLRDVARRVKSASIEKLNDGEAR